MECAICHLQVSSYKGLAIHLRSHKLDVKTYYDTYLKKNGEGHCTKCNKETNFLGLNKGYSLICINCIKSPKQITCLLCGRQIKGVASHFYNTHKISPKEYYDTYLKKANEGICKICGTPTNFISVANGYRTYCPNAACAQIDKVTQDKKRTNTFKKYEVMHSSQRQDVKDKQKQTCLEKYGTLANWSRPDIHKKAVELSHSKEANEKRDKTMIEKYGVTTMYKDPETHKRAVLASREPKINEKRNNTNLEKYGHINPFGGEDIKNKIYETNIKKYGVSLPAQNEEIKKKIVKHMKETNLNRYGVTNYSQTNEFKSTRKEHHNKIDKLDKELGDADE